MKKKIFNPTDKRIEVRLLGEDVVIPSKGTVRLDMGLGSALQELLPGLEYVDVRNEEEKEPVVKKEIEVIEEPVVEEKSSKKVKKSKKAK